MTRSLHCHPQNCHIYGNRSRVVLQTQIRVSLGGYSKHSKNYTINCSNPHLIRYHMVPQYQGPCPLPSSLHQRRHNHDNHHDNHQRSQDHRQRQCQQNPRGHTRESHERTTRYMWTSGDRRKSHWEKHRIWKRHQQLKRLHRTNWINKHN